MSSLEWDDIVGVSEVAARLGVSKSAVSQWKQRGKLPPPEREISGNPVWYWPAIAQWATATGRCELITNDLQTAQDQVGRDVTNALTGRAVRIVGHRRMATGNYALVTVAERP